MALWVSQFPALLRSAGKYVANFLVTATFLNAMMISMITIIRKVGGCGKFPWVSSYDGPKPQSLNPERLHVIA